MKVKINRWYNALLASLLALLGFDSCSKETETPDEYGAPYAEYQIRGNVTDEDGQPIPGIKARLGHLYDDNDLGQIQVMPYPVDSAETNAKGELQIDAPVYGPDMSMVLTDEDGDLNGGEFLSDTIALSDMKKEQVEEGKGWYQGKYKVSFTRQLKKK